jgi:ribosomal protein S18 acetylase RimI-like enzyme
MAPAARRAEREDAELLAGMLHDFNTEFSEPTPGTEVLMRRVLAFIENGEMTYLLGSEGVGDPAGFAQVSFRPSIWADEPVGYLEELYVEPARRGRGIGRAIMNAVIELAHERGAAGVEVVTGEDDTAARALYESLGFGNEIEGEQNARSLFYELNF